MFEIGVDIGGTNIKYGLVNEALEIVAHGSIPFPKTTAEDMADKLAAALRAMLAEQGVTEIGSIGIVVPGSIDRSGEVMIAAYNLGFHDVPLRAIMQTRFPGVPVYIANDANGAARYGRPVFRHIVGEMERLWGTAAADGRGRCGDRFKQPIDLLLRLFNRAARIDDGVCTADFFIQRRGKIPSLQQFRRMEQIQKRKLHLFRHLSFGTPG